MNENHTPCKLIFVPTLICYSLEHKLKPNVTKYLTKDLQHLSLRIFTSSPHGFDNQQILL